MPRFLTAFAFALLVATVPLHAATPSQKFARATLDPIAHQDAALTLVGPDGGEMTLDPAALEALGAWRLTTTTPWREVPATFEGPLLIDVLSAAGLEDAAAIRVVAENDYAVTIPRQAWDGITILVATRVDGAAHSRRARGPIQFVMDMAEYEASDVAFERYWVWMAARITPD